MQSKITYGATALALIGVLAIGAAAQADTAPTPTGAGHFGGRFGHMVGGNMKGRMPGVFGTVTAINGTTLSVTSKGFGKNTASTAYLVNAASATVFKNGATSTLSSIAVNDMVGVQGTVSGTSVTATSIRDGMGPRGMMGQHAPGQGAPGINIPQGNGQPIVAGNVTSVSGSTVTITNKSNVTYTIDATSAKVTRGNASSTVSAITVGDSLVVQGQVNGNAVVASTILDQKAAPASTNGQGAPRKGFFGAIGGFFAHLFGF